MGNKTVKPNGPFDHLNVEQADMPKLASEIAEATGAEQAVEQSAVEAARGPVEETAAEPPVVKQRYDLKEINFDNYEQELAVESELPLREGLDASHVEFRWWRHDELHKLDGTLKCGYWVPVRLGHPIIDNNFEELFVEQNHPAYPFDAHGMVCKGPFVRGQDGHRYRAQYLGARPAIAKGAEQQYRAKRAAQSFVQGNQGALKDPRLNATNPATGEQVIKPELVAPHDYRGKMMTSAGWAKVGNAQVR